MVKASHLVWIESVSGGVCLSVSNSVSNKSQVVTGGFGEGGGKGVF